MSNSTVQSLPGEPVDLTELRRVANDGTALRYALMELAAQTPEDRSGSP